MFPGDRHGDIRIPEGRPCTTHCYVNSPEQPVTVAAADSNMMFNHRKGDKIWLKGILLSAAALSFVSARWEQRRKRCVWQTWGNPGAQSHGTMVSAETCQWDAMSAGLHLAKQGKSCDAKVWGLPVLIRMAARPPDTLHPLISKERKRI